MKYTWIDYNSAYEKMVNSWLDEDAMRFTGCDEGFEEYYQYWVSDANTKIGENFWAKIIVNDAEPIGIVTLGLWESVFTISEFIIRPDRHGKQFGSSALAELIIRSKDIIGTQIKDAQAVIFPNNIASQKSFEKAGFKFHYEHPDGDAWYYKFVSSDNDSTT